VSREVEGLPALYKLEYLMPTGSFKDRGASVVISCMAAAGVARAVEDSSGNAGIALSAYAAHAGIQMEVMVPEDAARPKLAAIEACGGKVVRVGGGRAAASREALARAESGLPFASHVWNPFFLEGTRTFAFEIWEQLERRLPPRLFLPAGNGSLLIGAFDGFQQLREDGLADRVPRLMAVQAAACAPLVAGGPVDTPGPTQADGIRIGSPPRARRMQDALRRSGGGALAVSEAEITRAHRALALAGLDVEPTSAVALAGALQWQAADPDAARREIESEGPPLMPLTGWGARAPGKSP
jgi:threonine synthase